MRPNYYFVSVATAAMVAAILVTPTPPADAMVGYTASSAGKKFVVDCDGGAACQVMVGKLSNNSKMVIKASEDYLGPSLFSEGYDITTGEVTDVSVRKYILYESARRMPSGAISVSNRVFSGSRLPDVIPFGYDVLVKYRPRKTFSDGEVGPYVTKMALEQPPRPAAVWEVSREWNGLPISDANEIQFTVGYFNAPGPDQVRLSCFPVRGFTLVRGGGTPQIVPPGSGEGTVTCSCSSAGPVDWFLLGVLPQEDWTGREHGFVLVDVRGDNIHCAG